MVSEAHEEGWIRIIAHATWVCAALAALTVGLLYGQTSKYLDGVSVPYETHTNPSAWLLALAILMAGIMQAFLLLKFAAGLERIADIQRTLKAQTTAQPVELEPFPNLAKH